MVISKSFHIFAEWTNKKVLRYKFKDNDNQVNKNSHPLPQGLEEDGFRGEGGSD